MGFSEIALLLSGLAGVIGWYVAWRSRGETVDARKEIAVERAAATEAQNVAFSANDHAVTAEARWSAEVVRSSGLERQLAMERQSRQNLVDALAKSGAPVGDLLVDSALDELYPNPGSAGSGPGSGTSRDPAGVPGVVTGTAPKTPGR